mmetsp:Transcript_127695/g.238665  ORF Transcript_127695/g.238665 Transcript_127695/m.238665 type:complete len:339 (+) Transcript_127695:246-1262(+)
MQAEICIKHEIDPQEIEVATPSFQLVLRSFEDPGQRMPHFLVDPRPERAQLRIMLASRDQIRFNLVLGPDVLAAMQFPILRVRLLHAGIRQVRMPILQIIWVVWLQSNFAVARSEEPQVGLCPRHQAVRPHVELATSNQQRVLHISLHHPAIQWRPRSQRLCGHVAGGREEPVAKSCSAPHELDAGAAVALGWLQRPHGFRLCLGFRQGCKLVPSALRGVRGRVIGKARACGLLVSMHCMQEPCLRCNHVIVRYVVHKLPLNVALVINLAALLYPLQVEACRKAGLEWKPFPTSRFQHFSDRLPIITFSHVENGGFPIWVWHEAFSLFIARLALLLED